VRWTTWPVDACTGQQCWCLEMCEKTGQVRASPCEFERPTGPGGTSSADGAAARREEAGVSGQMQPRPPYFRRGRGRRAGRDRRHHRWRADQPLPSVRLEILDLIPLQEPIDPLLDPRQLGAFARGDESERHALAAHPPGPSHPVHIVVAEGGDVVIDDVGDARHVDAAPHHVGRHQQLHLPAAKCRHDPITSPLRHVAVDAGHVGQFLAQALIDLLRAPLGPAEDDRLPRLFSG
jgi:hypothetical protein